MTDDEDELFVRLTDPDNPRTPLHFKLLDRQVANESRFAFRDAQSTFHRARGYACGPAMGIGKPISRMFGDVDFE